MEANYRQLLDRRPNVAVLPWEATEAHNDHLPHGTDVIEAATLAEPGDHAGAMETALALHICPDLVVLPQAGAGSAVPW